MLKDMPTGPYYMVDFCNILYEGQNIPMGMYKIFIEKSPEDDINKRYPCFYTVVDGTSQPSLIKNKYL